MDAVYNEKLVLEHFYGLPRVETYSYNKHTYKQSGSSSLGEGRRGLSIKSFVVALDYDSPF